MLIGSGVVYCLFTSATLKSWNTPALGRVVNVDKDPTEVRLIKEVDQVVHGKHGEGK